MSIKDVENVIREILKKYNIDAHIWVTRGRFEINIGVSIPVAKGTQTSRTLENIETEHIAVDVLDTAIGDRYLELEIYVDNVKNLDLDQITDIILKTYEKYRAV